MLLYADLFEQETSWAHIKASEALMEAYGIPFCYYVDSLRVFRFVQGRDSIVKKISKVNQAGSIMKCNTWGSGKGDAILSVYGKEI